MNQENFELFVTRDLNLKIADQVVCNHENKNCCLYKSECICCDPYDTTVYRRLCCEECLDSELDSLLCGGHFSSLKYFIDNVEQSDSNQNDLFEMAEERYISIIREYIVDLNNDQLRKVMTKILKITKTYS